MDKSSQTKKVDEKLYIPIVEQYLDYLRSILGRSELTIKEYRYDLEQFFKFYLTKRLYKGKTEDEMDYSLINQELLQKIELYDFYAFISHLGSVKKASTANRSRKIASLRSFFKYLHTKLAWIKDNPAAELESPKREKKNPRYLELGESYQLLEGALNRKSQLSARDFCILTLFLNCGLRLSELCGLNLEDWTDNRLRVVGKGNKERVVYLNKACLDALHRYMDERLPAKTKDEKALFISRQQNRLSKAAVQLMVKTHLKELGLDASRYSTHKLRHTAATLMYKHGQIDIRTLQHILGHSSVSTTEIYTHLDNEVLEQAIEKHPLSKLEFRQEKVDVEN